ncbi:MAG: glycoside hydrolase family 43 protein [Chitinophagaceae bacterium]
MRCFLFVLFALIITPAAHTQQLVMPGDHPDPSVVKIGDTYWASATTSNWFPAFPLMKSKDLLQWNTVGHVFKQLPAWADYYFWAPEISYENGKVYVYYAAHKKNGNLCVGVASADKPEGPYKDHGPLMCEEAGSIDAFPMHDENGKLYLIWKEDGNSVGKPTPTWAQPMNEERTALTGEKKELFRNDVSWEGNLVEGVSMLRHGDYIYAFYAAAACCGRGCTYGSGVARAKNLLGPWEKYNRNPVIANSGQWKCPGHGTPVEKDGRYYFLYHAYDTITNVYTGRQGVLMEFKFTPDGWVEFPDKHSVSKPHMPDIKDEFNAKNLSLNWQWSVFQDVKYELKKGCLNLMAGANNKTVYLGQKTYSNHYDIVAAINTKRSDTEVGIGAIGDDADQVNVLYGNDTIRVMMLKDNKETIVGKWPVSGRNENTLSLKMSVQNGKDISFYYTYGTVYTMLNEIPVDGSFLPPWDRAVRAGLIVRGQAGRKGVYEWFEMHNK